MAHIEVEKLCKTINKSIVLEDINLDMSSGKGIWISGNKRLGKDNAYESTYWINPSNERQGVY